MINSQNISNTDKTISPSKLRMWMQNNPESAFNEYKIIDNKGTISFKQAEDKAFKEYTIFNKTQKIESDFDKETKILLTQKSKSN